MTFKKSIIFFLFSLQFFTYSAFAAPLTNGNFLFQSNGVITEFTMAGEVVQSFTVPDPIEGWRGTEYARDIAVIGTDTILVYNGTFEPYVSMLDLNTNSWSHFTDPNMWTVNNGSYGGIAADENFVYVTSMGPDYYNADGAVRFDLTTLSSFELNAGVGAIDLNLGLDGLLYILYPGGSPGGRFINVYDPDTMALIDEISLAAIFGHTAHRAIAINSASEIFIADWDGDIQKIDPLGNVVDETNVCNVSSTCNLYDIDINSSGDIIVTSRFADIILLDSDLEVVSTFGESGYYWGSFATFIDAPKNNALSNITDIGYSTVASAFTSSAPGQYTLSATGNNIGGWSDNVSFVYEEVEGDVDFFAQLSSIENGWSTGGVMIRKSLDANSVFAAALVEKNETGLFISRDVDKAHSSVTISPELNEGDYLRITKTGNLVTVQISDDGQSWSSIGTMAWSYDGGFYIGLAGTTVENVQSTEFVFNNVSLN